MHEAFLPIRLLRDYPYALESLTCYDNFLLVGTKQGLLLVYELTPNTISHPVYFIPPFATRPSYLSKSVSPNLEDEPTPDQSESEGPATVPPPTFSTRVHITRTFGKKPILQLAAIPEIDILLALAEGHMNAYQLKNCQLITTVPNSKGASVFASCLSPVPGGSSTFSPSGYAIVLPTQGATTSPSSKSTSSVDSQTSPTKDGIVALRICVAVKRRLMLWRWDSLAQEFVNPGGPEDQITRNWLPEISVSDTVRALYFCDSTHLIVGLRAEYLRVNLTNGEARSLSYPGRNQLPLICPLAGCFQISQANPGGGNAVPHDLSFRVSESHSNSSTFIHVTPRSRSFSRQNSAFDWTFSPSGTPASGACLLGLGKDDLLMAVFSDENESDGCASIRWTGAPHCVHVYPPYLIGAMDQFLEVRVGDPCELVQQLSISRVQALCHYGGWFYAATSSSHSSTGESAWCDSPSLSPRSLRGRDCSPRSKASGTGNEVWLILSMNRGVLLRELVKRKEFQLAVLLAKEAPWMGQVAFKTQQIEVLHAFYLYREREFVRALQMFTQQHIDPSHVLGLFPNLLSETLCSQIRYPGEKLEFTTEQFTEAAEPLITYLLTWRRLLRQAMELQRTRLFSDQSPSIKGTVADEDVSESKADVIANYYPITEDSPTIKSSQKLLELVDTSLLKCYLATNTARVAPLLRQANSCNLEESEKTLVEYHRYQDLVMLYQAHKLHRKALSLLQQMGVLRLKRLYASELSLPKDCTAPISVSHSQEICEVDSQSVDSAELEQLGNPRNIVHYFQNLGPSHFDLVVDYGGWLVHKYPRSWMRIFTSWERNLASEDYDVQTTGDSGVNQKNRALSLTYRGQVLKYLEKCAIHLIIPFLEQLIFTRYDAVLDSEEEEENEDGVSDGADDSEGNESDVVGSQIRIRKDSSKVGGSPAIPRRPKKLPVVSKSYTDSTSHLRCAKSQPFGAANNCLWNLPGFRRQTSDLSQNQFRVDPDILPRIVRRTDDPETVELHTRYVAALMAHARSVQPANKPFACRVADEQPKWGVVARLRRRVLRFLTHPDAIYSSSRLLSKCPYDAFFEERAILLANLNHHEQALTLWVHVLDDWNRAVQHCMNVYDRAVARASSGVHSGTAVEPNERSNLTKRLSSMGSLQAVSRSPVRDSLEHGSDSGLPQVSVTPVETNDGNLAKEEDIFFLLVQICLQPPDPVSLGIVIQSHGESKESGSAMPSFVFSPKHDRALEVLRRFEDRVNASKVIKILTTTRFADLAEFLKTTFTRQEGLLAHLVFLHGAARAELAASRAELVRATSQQFVLSTGALCRTCRRRIGTSAFARYPSTGELEHYGCCQGLTGKT
ncbi:unnamed protein product [Calicophoron daubneyi]|uniref:CNH domain-containing protein n=1 Tax=Calicophoron daubneyi TaxID=300641 RepID=A0AAV2TZ01_CALDB